MIVGPFITPHAVNQFRERIAGVAMTYEAARDAIIRELHEHGRAPVPTSNGRAWMVRTRGGEYEFRAVIGPGEGPAPAVVTILASGRSRQAQRVKRARQRRRQISANVSR